MKRRSAVILGAFWGIVGLFGYDVVGGMVGTSKRLKKVYCSWGDVLGIFQNRISRSFLSSVYLFLYKRAYRIGNSFSFFGVCLKDGIFSKFSGIERGIVNSSVVLVVFCYRTCKIDFPCLCGTI